MGTEKIDRINSLVKKQLHRFYPRIYDSMNRDEREKKFSQGEFPYYVIAITYQKEDEYYGVGKKVSQLRSYGYDNSYQETENVHIATIKDNEKAEINIIKATQELVQAHEGIQSFFEIIDYLEDERTENARYFLKQYISSINEKNDILRRTIPLFREYMSW
jgi:hypothetical protein